MATPAPVPEPQETPEAAAPAGDKNKKLIGLLLRVGIFVALAGAAFAVALFVVRPLFPPLKGGSVPPPPTEKAAPAKFGRVISLESVVVNVAQTEGRRYLKATIQLEVAEDEKVVKEVESRKVQIVDLLVATLAKKTLTDVTTPDALDRLRGELYERISQEFDKEKVRRIFITEFVVQ
jgi:flagellar FliL protein